MRLKPATEDLIVRDPVTQERLPADGMDCPDTSFWRRRLRDGSVVPAFDPTATKGDPKPEPKKKDA